MELRKCLLVALTASMLFGSMAVHANRDWVTFKAQQSKSQVVVELSYKPSSFKLQYYDQTNKKWVGITATRTFTLTNAGDSVQVRGHNPNGLNCVESGLAKYIRFQATAGQVAVSGDLLTLVDTTTTTVTEIPGIYCFYRLFSNSNSCLVDASRLRIPANTIAKYSCKEMFNGNYGLKNTPDMSQVKSIGHHGCEKMFMSCKGLEETADMPNVRTVGEGGCQSMYSGCTSLTQAYELYAKYAYESAYKSMFQGCTSLTTAPKMNAVEMFVNTCMSMYKGCTKLTSVPDLEAPYLENGCYQSMFEDCTALENAPAIKASELGYTIHGKTIYYKTCMKDMFKGCSNLKYIEVYFSDWFDSDASKNLNPTNTWVMSVPTKNTCVFSAPCELPDQRGNSYIPTNWQFRCFNTLTLNVEENGGSWSDNKDYENRIYKSDVSTIPTAEKKDYLFTGWFEHADGTGKQYTPGETLTDSWTFYACFKPKGDIPPVSESCIDYTDFTVTTIDTSRCYENNGKYYWTNWSTTSESLDYGPRRKISRYTVHRNTNEYDGRTGGLLKTTLPDDRPSVRLGNWLNKGAERITYKYKVPSDKTVLMLYYAAVLEDPKHSSDHQPRFTLEMKDKNGATLGECVCFDFKSGAALGDKTWHIEDDICWKDWTAIGVNLKAKAGEDIQICLTTYDCIEGGHFGYAYFALDCSEGEMKTTSCGASEEATFKAPDGFKYKWYEETTPETIISTKQSITVSDAKGKTYMCDVINPEKEDCYFTLKATPETRYPLAMYSIKQISDGTTDYIRTTNNSCVSNDGITPKTPKEDVDSCHWTLKYKNTGAIVEESNDKEPIFSITKGGVYELVLQAFLKNGDTGEVCDSEGEVKEIVVVRKGGISYVHQDTTLCGNETLQEWKGHEGNPYVKIDDNTYHDTIISNPTVDNGGFDSPRRMPYGEEDPSGNLGAGDKDTTLYILHITRQFPTPNDSTANLLLGQSITWHGQVIKATSEGIIYAYDTAHYTQTGCDSILYKLTINVTTRPIEVTKDTTCSNEPYEWVDHGERYSKLTKPGYYYDTIVSPQGDTTFYELQLTVWNTDSTTEWLIKKETEYPFEWRPGIQIKSQKDSGTKWTTKNIHGCDSVVTLMLRFGYKEIPQDTILCGNTPLSSWKGHTKYVKIDDKTYHDTIFSGSPQDTTVYILNIQRQMAISRATKDAIVKGQTYTWRGKDYKATTLETIRDYDTTYYPITGCDSVYYSLELTVTEHPMVKTYDKTCANEPYTWQGHESKYSGLKKTGTYLDTIVSGKGDTTFYMLQLTVNDTFAVNDYKSVTMADFPFPWNGYTIQSKADDGKQWRGQTVHGCDSVVTLRLQMECQGVKGTIRLDTICADQKEMYATLRVTAGKAESYSLHYVDQDPKGHFQDVQDIRLMGSAEERLTIPFVAKDSINYIRPNDYNVTISVKDSCGKTVEFPLVLHVQYPSWIIQQRWNDVLAVTNEHYNGGYMFSSIIWYHEGARMSARGEHNSYIYTGENGKTLDYGTSYWVGVVRTGEDKTICSCAFKPKQQSDNTSFKPLQIAKRQSAIHIQAGTDGTYMLYDICGKQIETGNVVANEWTQIAEAAGAGTYIVSFHGTNGQNETKKFVKN